jgi:hypothetical protein
MAAAFHKRIHIYVVCLCVGLLPLLPLIENIRRFNLPWLIGDTAMAVILLLLTCSTGRIRSALTPFRVGAECAPNAETWANFLLRISSPLAPHSPRNCTPPAYQLGCLIAGQAAVLGFFIGGDVGYLPGLAASASFCRAARCCSRQTTPRTPCYATAAHLPALAEAGLTRRSHGRSRD